MSKYFVCLLQFDTVSNALKVKYDIVMNKHPPRSVSLERHREVPVCASRAMDLGNFPAILSYVLEIKVICKFVRITII